MNNNSQDKEIKKGERDKGKTMDADDIKKKKDLSISEVEDLIDEITAERDEFKNKYLRALANYENLRKRTQIEKEKIYNLAVECILREILPILDDFQRGFELIENENKNNDDSFQDGIRLIYSKFNNILKSYEVETFQSKGEKFNPNMHEAVHVVESDKPEGTILEEIEKGYHIKNKTLRPAKVIVAKEKEDKDKKEKNNNKED